MSDEIDTPLRDLSAWQRFEDLMGTARAEDERVNLGETIDAMLAHVPGPDEAAAELRSEAHKLVARAAILGFPELSLASARVDAVLRAGLSDDARAAISRWRNAALRARAVLAQEIAVQG